MHARKPTARWISPHSEPNTVNVTATPSTRANPCYVAAECSNLREALVALKDICLVLLWVIMLLLTIGLQYGLSELCRYLTCMFNYLVLLRSELFWDITQCIVVIPYCCFGDNLSVPSSSIKILTHEDGTNRLFQSVHKEWPLYAAWYPRRAHLIYAVGEAWNLILSCCLIQVVEKANTKSVRSSTAFFNSLQEEVKSHIRRKASDSIPGQLKNVKSAKKLKL